MSDSPSQEYQDSPRVNSQHIRAVFDELVEISRHIEFKHPIFRGRMKRNLSAGSVQAFINELALSSEGFLNTLRGYMRDGGKDWEAKHIKKLTRYSPGPYRHLVPKPDPKPEQQKAVQQQPAKPSPQLPETQAIQAKTKKLMRIVGDEQGITEPIEVYVK